MSEKKQGTACGMRERMMSRYGEELYHKHNKNHLPYRKHYRSHPCQPNRELNGEEMLNQPTGILRAIKLRKIRKRLDKGRIH